jgi:tellurium resistance protein TerD
MKTRCPHCKSFSNIPIEYNGRKVKCPVCKRHYLAKDTFPPKPEPDPVKCPRCASTQITASNKGFSGGNAVGGAFVFGPLGLLAGLIGSKKIFVVCLNCGHRWHPG